MPVILVVLALILVPALIAVSVPLSIIQRYRAGTARRLARGWVAASNVFFIAISVTLFLVTAAMSSPWIPGAFTYSALGMCAGGVLGFAGIALTRWEKGSKSLHYTPNRWLVLSITVVVAARIGFGLWRAWHAWRFTPEEKSWLAESGLAGSMAVGAVVIGYYFIYWAGVWKHVQRHQESRRAQFQA